MDRRGCARTFARPPLRSAASPRTGSQKGPMEGKVARGLLRAPPLRRRFPRDWRRGRANGKKRLRADFCAPSFEERRSPRTGGQEGPVE